MTSTSAPQVPAAANGKRRKLLLFLLAVVVLATIAWTLWYALYARFHQDTDDAYVQGNVVSITPQTVGTVVSIGADDGMKVRAGQVLVQLDPADAQVAYEQAIANLAATVRQVRGLYSSVDAGLADLQSRQVAVQKARADVKRRDGLVASGAVSVEELSHARDELAAAEAALSGAQGNLSRNRALVDATTVASQPQVRAAAALLRQAYLNLQRAAIVTPVDGYVARRSVQLGQRVQPGAALMTVVPLEQVWVEANFKETQMAHMRIGQPVKVHADLYGDGVDYEGRLGSLGLGTGSAFSLLPAQNASGNWIKIVQRVPVRIELDPKQLRKYPLRLGLSMSIDVDVHDQGGPVLPATPPQKPVLATDAYAQQLAEANALIDSTIRDNLPRSAHG